MDLSQLLFLMRLAWDKLLCAGINFYISILMLVEFRVNSGVYLLVFGCLLIASKSKYFKRKAVLCRFFLGLISKVIEFSVSLSL